MKQAAHLAFTAYYAPPAGVLRTSVSTMRVLHRNACARSERIDAHRRTHTVRKVKLAFTTGILFPVRVANSVNEQRRVALEFDHGW